jgi:hypothetical protein
MTAVLAQRRIRTLVIRPHVLLFLILHADMAILGIPARARDDTRGKFLE